MFRFGFGYSDLPTYLDLEENLLYGSISNQMFVPHCSWGLLLFIPSFFLVSLILRRLVTVHLVR